MSEVERIAAGLTEAQRDAVIYKSGSPQVVMSPEVKPLWYAIQKNGHWNFTISLNDTGKAVRAHLKDKAQ